jgi:hypothetical protein
MFLETHGIAKRSKGFGVDRQSVTIQTYLLVCLWPKSGLVAAQWTERGLPVLKKLHKAGEA